MSKKFRNCGFGYNVDKPTHEKIKTGDYKQIFWKCELQSCKGRAKTHGPNGLIPPLILTFNHDHPPNLGRLQEAKLSSI